MALVKFGTIVTAASGKAGGTVFSRNKSGSYIKAWANPTNPQTDAQLAVRSTLTTVSTAWRSLTDLQRDAWLDATPWRTYTNRLGEVKTYTSQQLFMKQNMALASQSLSILTAPTVPQPSMGFEILGFVWSGLFVTVDFQRADASAVFPGSNYFVIIDFSLPVPPGRKPTQWRQAGAFNSSSPQISVGGASASFVENVTDLEDLIGPVSPGEFVAVRLRPLNTLDPWTYPSTQRTIETS